jgi:hypothetical protein
LNTNSSCRKNINRAHHGQIGPRKNLKYDENPREGSEKVAEISQEKTNLRKGTEK